MRRVRLVGMAAAAWLVIAATAVANGVVRQAVLVPLLGEDAAPILSVAILAAAIVAVQWFLVERRWRDVPTSVLWAIGAGWAMGTVLFEVALGRLVLGMNRQALLSQYDLLGGNPWSFVPVLMIAGMPAIRTLRRPSRDP